MKNVDICGHATIATFSTLLSLGFISTGKYLQETKAGILGVEIQEDLSIMMNQNTPIYYQTIDKQEIADSLNITTSEMIVSLMTKNNEVIDVKVGGKALNLSTIEIEI